MWCEDGFLETLKIWILLTGVKKSLFWNVRFPGISKTNLINQKEFCGDFALSIDCALIGLNRVVCIVSIAYVLFHYFANGIFTKFKLKSLNTTKRHPWKCKNIKSELSTYREVQTIPTKYKLFL